jgi:hypothetical protein
MTTEQPKWHITFDGILLRQVKRYWGLADKGDAPIKLGHQLFGCLHEQFHQASTFKQRKRFIIRAFRMQSHPERQRALNEMNRIRPRHDKNNPRQQRRRDNREDACNLLQRLLQNISKGRRRWKSCKLKSSKKSSEQC